MNVAPEPPSTTRAPRWRVLALLGVGAIALVGPGGTASAEAATPSASAPAEDVAESTPVSSTRRTVARRAVAPRPCRRLVPPRRRMVLKARAARGLPVPPPWRGPPVLLI